MVALHPDHFEPPELEMPTGPGTERVAFLGAIARDNLISSRRICFEEQIE
jgi:hypothetical protein